MTPVVGGIRIRAHSSGQSLLILPLQYSQCLELDKPSAQLVRTNLVMTGLLFTSDIDARISNRFGYWSTECCKADLAALSNRGVRSDGSIRQPPICIRERSSSYIEGSARKSEQSRKVKTRPLNDSRRCVAHKSIHGQAHEPLAPIIGDA